MPELGIAALIMNHVPDARRASSEKMVRALGFGPVDFPASTDASALRLRDLEDSGLVAKNWTWAHKISDAVKLRYIAHALDYRAVLQLAVDRWERSLEVEVGTRGHARSEEDGGLSKGRKMQWVGVFEDDLFVPGRPSVVAARIRGALEQVPADADALYLEWCHDTCSESHHHPQMTHIKIPFEPYCSAAILYTLEGARRASAALRSIDGPVDDMLKTACNRGRLRCYALRLPAFMQDLYWGSAVETKKAKTHFHDIYMEASICRHYPVELEWSLWFESLRKGYAGPQISHPEDAGPILLKYLGCRTGSSYTSSTLTILAQDLVVGVEYLVGVSLVAHGGGAVYDVWAGLVAVNPGETVLEIDAHIDRSHVMGALGEGGAVEEGRLGMGGMGVVQAEVRISDTSPLVPEDETLLGKYNFAWDAGGCPA